MDNDRELLMLAAKAANIETQGYCTNGYMFIGDGEKGYFDRWNPLTNDGDALRLASKCNIGLSVDTTYVDSIAADYVLGDVGVVTEEPVGGDKLSAIRRCITRAAAEIGRQGKD